MPRPKRPTPQLIAVLDVLRTAGIGVWARTMTSAMLFPLTRDELDALAAKLGAEPVVNLRPTGGDFRFDMVGGILVHGTIRADVNRDGQPVREVRNADGSSCFVLGAA